MQFTQEKWKQIGFACSALAFIFIVLAILTILFPSFLSIHFIWPMLLGFALMGAATYALHRAEKK